MGLTKTTRQPTTRAFQSDKEEGDNTSDHDPSNFSVIDPDEHDSQSSSNPSLEEGRKQDPIPHSYSSSSNNNNYNKNHDPNHSIYNSNSNTRTRPGNKNDPELGSDSVHKRALHEAGLHSGTSSSTTTTSTASTSVFRGKSEVVVVQNNTTTEVTEHRQRSIPIRQTPSDGSESSLPNQTENSNKSRASGKLETHQLLISKGNDETPTLRTNFQLTERILTSRLWRMLQTKNPIFLLLITGVAMMGVGLYTQSYATLSLTLDQVILTEHERRQTVEGHFESIERDMNHLQRQLLELHPDASLLLSSSSSSSSEHGVSNNNNNNNNDDDATNGDGVFDEIVAVKERIRLESSRISAFEKHIQSTSLRDATRKYGTGVIRVELTLDFLSDRTTTSNNNNNNNNSNEEEKQQQQQQQQRQNTIVLEMAPLEVMPHSVYTFLEMVDHHLLDGCSFILNAMNILKAAPLPYDKNDPNNKTAKQMDLQFRKLGLETVSFREYNELYPHEKYTIGFAADGGPEFYINTGDNSKEHVGEPCFARIVSGYETVTKMEQEPLRSGMWIKKRIGIQKAIVL